MTSSSGRHTLPDELVGRYWLGEATATEAAVVAEWAAEHPAAWAQYEQMRRGLATEAWTGLSTLQVEQLVAATLQATQRTTEATPSLHIAASRPMRGTARVATRRPFGKAMRGVAFLAAVFLLVVMVRRHFASPSFGTETRYATIAGERTTVTLPDGTRMILAPHTTVRIGPHFGGETRTVFLQGQAYFDIAASSRAPFLVRTGAVTTRVLGTTFDVRHYATDAAVQVAVLSGKVVTSGREASATLTAGRVARVTDSTAETQVVRDVQDYVGWKDGRLVFTNVRASEMLATVGRWYGYDFRATDSTVGMQRVTAVVRIAEPDETLAAIRSLLDVTVRVDGHVITLTPRRRGASRPTYRTGPGITSTQTEVGK